MDKDEVRLTKKELLEMMNDVFDTIENGEVERDGEIFKGHPGFYYFHSKEEMFKELINIIDIKDEYSRYDFYYYIQRIIKFMLNKYDSHTEFKFDSILFPLIFKMIDGKLYVIEAEDKSLIGSEVKSINGVDINILIEEMKNIICYASDEYLKYAVEMMVRHYPKLKSLPSIRNNDEMDYEVEIDGEIKHVKYNPVKENFNRLVEKNKPNFNLDIIDGIGVITYNSCSDMEGMLKLVSELEKLGLNDFIVDLRGNGGGDSRVNKPLVNFLRDKNIIMLVDEAVFSSARMMMVDLKRIGAESIGTSPGTPVNCFGNNLLRRKYDNVNMTLSVSTIYWYYKKDLSCFGIRKDRFEDVFKGREEELEPWFLSVDEKVERPLSDYTEGNDTVLNTALLRVVNKRNSMKI